MLKKIEDFAVCVFTKLEKQINAFSDSMLLLFLSLFYFAWRILFLPMFEFSGDAVWKWRFLRYYHETGKWFPLIPDHHQGRWAQNIPICSLMDLFDSSSMWIGAILPVLCGFSVLLLVWFICRRISSKMTAFSACLCTMMYAVFFQESAQVLPSLPCTMFTLLALYLILLYLSNPARLYYPLLAGLSLGLAWGCKVTACYWCAGIGLFLLFFPVPGKNLFAVKRFRIGWDVILFTLGFLLVFIPEFFIINDFFHVSHGRLSMLSGHLDGRMNDAAGVYHQNLLQYILSPVLIFLDFSGKVIYTAPFCLLFLLVLSPLFLQLKDKTLPLQNKLLAFTLLIAGLFHSYLVTHIFPFQHPERPLPRYFLTLSIIAIIILFTAQNHFPKFKEKFRLPFRLIYWCIALVSGILMFIGWINDPVINGDNLFNKIQAYQCVKLYKEKNIPWLIRYEKPHRYTSRTHKVALLWKTNLCSLPELSGILAKNPQQLQKEWSEQKPVVDSRGNRYLHIFGPRPVPGKTADCIVVLNSQVRCKTLSIANPKGNK